MFEYILLRQSRTDFIERLFYLKTMVNIYLLDIVFIYWGWQKLIRHPGNTANPIADSSTHQLKNPSFLNHQIPNKIKQNPKSPPPNPLSYPISSNPTKIKHFPSFIPKNQTLIPPKIYPQFQNLPYLQTLLPITFFSPQNRPNHLSPHPPTQGGTQKLHTKSLQ